MDTELPFDPGTRGARRLLRTAQQIRDCFEPITVDVLKPIHDLNDQRSLSPGQRVDTPRRSVERLIEQQAVRLL